MREYSPALLYVFVLLFCLAASVFATDIQRVEYFIDSDPGPGNGHGLGLFEDSASYWVYHPGWLLIGLPYGEHVFYVRYEDGLSRWSAPKGRKFYVGAQKEIVSAEEFFDSDPGQGFGQTKFVPDTTDTYSWATHTHSQAYGQHIFYSRFQTEDGFWGIARPRRINISPGQTFITAEYFTNSDPGNGNGTNMDVPDYTFEGTGYLTTNFQTSNPGKKMLGLRLQMSGGYWGQPTVRTVNALPVSATDSIHIGGAEAFFDSDPGIGNGAAMSAVDGQFADLEEQGTATLSTTGLSSGVHTVCARVRDASSTWTNTLCTTVPLPIRTVIQPLSTGNPLAPNVKLTWETDSLATAYNVHSDSVFTGPFTSFTPISAPDTTVTLPAAAPLRQYYYVLPVGPVGFFHGIPRTQSVKQFIQ